MRTPTSNPGTCPPNSGPKAGPGFTIIEMVVVLAIIGLIFAMVLPRTTAMRGVQLRSSSRNISSIIKLAYSSAAVNKTTYRMVFDLDEQSYWVEREEGEEFKEVAEPLLAKRYIPEEVYIRYVQVLDRECSSFCQEFLYFTPGGYVEEASIYLALNDDSQVTSIFTRPMIGRAVIVEGELTREEWEESEGYR